MTKHPAKPGLVDMRPFAEGSAGISRKGKRFGVLTARSELISELMPAIKLHLAEATAATVDGFHRDLSTWWRLLDRTEGGPIGETQTPTKSSRITSVEQLNELHRQLAIDSGMSKGAFSAFFRVVTIARDLNGIQPLFWSGPGEASVTRHLAHFNFIAALFEKIKRHWLGRLDEWRSADDLLDQKTCPCDASEDLLLKNIVRFENISKSLPKGQFLPSSPQLRVGYRKPAFRSVGYSVKVMYDARYPNARDVRTAFLLCLAGSGWNPEVFLDLPVDASPKAVSRTPFIAPHRSDPRKYIMSGFKWRGKSEPTFGDIKTDRSPGNIIRELVDRTWPLRQQLISDLAALKDKYHFAKTSNTFDENLKFEGKIREFERRVKSPWLYVSDKGEIVALDSGNYRTVGPVNVLKSLIDITNEELVAAGAPKMPYIKPTDFRDAFAMYQWRSSGGSVLQVMHLLAQKHLQTAIKYVDNNLLNAENFKTFNIMGNALWQQLASRGFDPTLLAKEVQDGPVSLEQRERLDRYRDLKLSRCGMGCPSPTNPPPEIDPNFSYDGSSLCSVQRCTICELGILLPTSLDGVAMRRAELEWQEANLPISAIATKIFRDEVERTRLHLLCFDDLAVEAAVAHWKAKIASGEHSPSLF